MTTYHRSERHAWRYALRRFAWRINLALSLLTLLLVLLPASASARSCPSGYTRIPHGCARLSGAGARCDPGYYGQFSRSAVGAPWTVRCVRGPAVQP